MSEDEYGYHIDLMKRILKNLSQVQIFIKDVKIKEANEKIEDIIKELLKEKRQYESGLSQIW